MKTEKEQKDLEKRRALELQLDILTNAMIEVECSPLVSETSFQALELIVEKHKKEIEQELIMLPRDTSDDYDNETKHEQ